MLRKSITFLRDLLANNRTKDWFEAHRGDYLQAKEEYEQFIDRLIIEIRRFDPGIGNTLTAKDCVYRIYRDVRFSLDKTPYKRYLGAYIAPGGRKSELCGYYFHLEPDKAGFLNHSLWSGGVYAPDAKTLKAVRTDIYENIDEYKEVIFDPNFTSTFSWFGGDSVKTAPKGFPKDFPDMDLIKPKDFSFYKNIDEALLTSDQLLEKSIEVYRKMLPYNEFMNRSILYRKEMANDR
ncbi:TIGR02453 family protein [Bacteroidia bacterium]|nr:TIGR02453 family protein [Bacteroidia bacterium]